MRARTHIFIPPLALLAALALAACGGSEDAGEEPAQASAQDATEEPTKAVGLEMGEWFFETDAAEVKAGKVTVAAENIGDIDHELIAVRTDMPADQMPMTDEGLDADKAGELVIGSPHGHDEGAADDHHGAEMDEHMDDDHGDKAGAPPVAYGTRLAVGRGGESSNAVLAHGGEESDGHDAAGDEPSGAKAKGEHAEGTAEEGHIEPGETRTYEVDLEPGNYVLMCSIPGHYQAGQFATLTVVE